MAKRDAQRDEITAMPADLGCKYPGREVCPHNLGRRMIVDAGYNRVVFVSRLKGFGYKS